jgi:hypothetical protein
MKYRFALHTKIDCPFNVYYHGGSEYYDECTGLWRRGSEGRKKWEAAAYPELHKRFEGRGYGIAKRGWNMLFRLRRREGGEICFGNHSLLSYYPRFWAEEKGQEKLFEGRRADWFAKGYKGQPPQMCYTDQGLVEQVAKDACEFFETGKSYPDTPAGGDYFCIEPMDNPQFCKCASCRKWGSGEVAGIGSPAATPPARSSPTAATATTSSSSSTQLPGSSARSTPTSASFASRT